MKEIRRSDDPFAKTIEEILNQNSREGWSYVRTDSVSERKGRWPFRKIKTVRELLVFRRDAGRLLARPQIILDDDEAEEPVRARRVSRPVTAEFIRGRDRPLVLKDEDLVTNVTAAE